MKTFAISNNQETAAPIDGVNEWEFTVGGAPEKAMAAGVLHQAAADLRRFRAATDPVGREMYADACRWFASNNRGSPYAFRNVCDALGLTPAKVREEVFADAASSRAAHAARVAWATAIHFLGSASNLMLSRRAASLATPPI